MGKTKINMEYAHEYISDEAKGVDNSDRDSRDGKNGQKLYPERRRISRGNSEK